MPDPKHFHYKCRSEFVSDFCRFMAWIIEKGKSVKLFNNKLYDTERPIESVWEFSSNLNYSDLFDIMIEADKVIGDLYVMYGTLRYKEDFSIDNDHFEFEEYKQFLESKFSSK